MMSQVRILLAEYFFCLFIFFAALAQTVERFHGKEEVAGSIPASGLIKRRLRNYI
jgi:hypothetical protein